MYRKNAISQDIYILIFIINFFNPKHTCLWTVAASTIVIHKIIYDFSHLCLVHATEPEIEQESAESASVHIVCIRLLIKNCCRQLSILLFFSILFFLLDHTTVHIQFNSLINAQRVSCNWKCRTTKKARSTVVGNVYIHIHGLSWLHPRNMDL